MDRRHRKRERVALDRSVGVRRDPTLKKEILPRTVGRLDRIEPTGSTPDCLDGPDIGPVGPVREDDYLVTLREYTPTARTGDGFGDRQRIAVEDLFGPSGHASSITDPMWGRYCPVVLLEERLTVVFVDSLFESDRAAHRTLPETIVLSHPFAPDRSSRPESRRHTALDRRRNPVVRHRVLSRGPCFGHDRAVDWYPVGSSAIQRHPHLVVAMIGSCFCTPEARGRVSYHPTRIKIWHPRVPISVMKGSYLAIVQYAHSY